MEEHFMRLVLVGPEAEGLGKRQKAVNSRTIQSADPEIDRAKSANPNRAESRFDFFAGHLSVSSLD
jgi:hypothetical protein